MERTQQGAELESATIGVAGGLRVTITNLGAAITSIRVPLAGEWVDAVLSYPVLENYRDDSFFMGSTVGPYANRISNGRFTLDGQEYLLNRNETSSGHCLHGGESGLHQHFFELQKGPDDGRVVCRAVLEDGAGGFPGRREVIVSYQLVSGLALAIDFDVRTNRNTVVSLANHAYFNLGGSIEDCLLKVRSDAYSVVDRSLAPTGELCPVAGSSFDLSTPTRIGDRVFDHNFALRRRKEELEPAATLCNPENGLRLDLLTTQPGLQVYTGDSLAAPFRPRQGICLEAQGFPDAPNQPVFPSARLKAGECYRQRTIYEFKRVTY